MADSEMLVLLPVSMSPGQPILSIPPGDIDGAVAELATREDGTITAEIRIPAPKPGRM
jgi:hypothetical protein